jgi:hypothetical protein
MPLYSVIRKSDQVEVYRYSADEPIEWDGFEFSEFDHVVVTLPVEVPPPSPPPQPRLITRRAFRNRFTQAEKIAIEIASLDVPTADMQQRAMAAALRASQQDVAVAQYIDLDLIDTRAGVQSLEDAGLLEAGRAAVILDGPISEEEAYRG